MNLKSWMTGLLLLAAGALLEAYAEEYAAEDAVEFQAPEHGSIKTVALGRGESMSFVRIAPMDMWVGRFEVTNGQFRRYDPEHESGDFHGYYLDERGQPAVHVSWEDAQNYCSWLNRHFDDQLPRGYVFRLPTEAEWETFAACGDNRRFPWGDEWPPPNDRNYRGEEGVRGIFRFFGARNFIRGHRNDFIVSAPVDRSGTNEWSLFGVGGNVWEWCLDWFDEDHASKVVRGASWSNYQKDVLALTNRAAAAPQGKTAMIGFRVVIGKPADEL